MNERKLSGVSEVTANYMFPLQQYKVHVTADMY